jgi:RNA polymerase sigma factor (sigma-70 family)
MDSLQSWATEYQAAAHLDRKLVLAERIAGALWPRLHRFLSARCPISEVDDLTQAAVLAVINDLPRFKGRGEFEHWYYRIAGNKLATFLERRKRVQPVDDKTLWALIEGSGRTRPMSAADRLALKEALELVGRAKPPCQDHLVDVYFYGWTFVELGQSLGITEDSARMKVNRCVELAQSLVAEKGVAHA